MKSLKISQAKFLRELGRRVAVVICDTELFLWGAMNMLYWQKSLMITVSNYYYSKVLSEAR
jgi:hypothetical protein